MAKARVLKEIRLDETSVVDKGAGEGCQIKLIKRAQPATPTYEEQLQAAADAYCQTVAKGAGRPVSEFEAYRKRLFEAGPRTEPEPAPLPTNDAYGQLLKRATRLAEREGLTEAQAFAKVAEADPELFGKAKRPAKVGNVDVDPKDDTDADIDEAETDPADVSADAHDGVGIKPFEGASGNGRGRSSSTYLSSGANANNTPRNAVMGAVEGSYDPKARPRSATKAAGCDGERAVLTPKQARRYEKFLSKSPNGNHNDALWFSRASKEQRQRYKAARKAG